MAALTLLKPLRSTLYRWNYVLHNGKRFFSGHMYGQHLGQESQLKYNVSQMHRFQGLKCIQQQFVFERQLGDFKCGSDYNRFVLWFLLRLGLFNRLHLPALQQPFVSPRAGQRPVRFEF
jgi:hypothetical protein